MVAVLYQRQGMRSNSATTTKNLQSRETLPILFPQAMATREANRTETRSVVCPSHEQIAARAYAIYLERGCQHGHDVDDWLQAEYELLQLPVEQLAKMKPPLPRSKRTSCSLIEIVRAALR